MGGGGKEVRGGRQEVRVRRRKAGGGRWEATGGRSKVGGGSKEAGGGRREAGGEKRQAGGGKWEVTSSINQHYTYTQEVSYKSVEYEKSLSGRISGQISGLTPKPIGIYSATE